ncbi:MAG: DUF3696 domain-containing protein [Armatimonadetes bacterium]|nr:DUF3696 domain-containing protein [Armatimonadota bacterium]
MLTEMRLVNFKSWADTGVFRLAPITGFFGANSSGKTSLLQALLLLKQTSESSDRNMPLQFGTKGSLIHLGDFQSVVTGRSLESAITIQVGWRREGGYTLKDLALPAHAVVSSESLGFQTEVGVENGGGKTARLSVLRMEYAVGDARFGMKKKQDAKNDYELFSSADNFQFSRTQGRAWALPPPSKCYGFPDQTRAYFQNAGFLSDLELNFEEILHSINYLGPLRAYPERSYAWTGSQPPDMGRSGELAVEAILSSRDRNAFISQGKGRKRVTLEAYVAQWLQKIGLIAEFRVHSVSEGSQIFQVLVKKNADSPEALITDVGFGVSQILPVIVLCFYAPEGSTIVLEQPEIHLHPSVQSCLADIFIDAWKKRKVQIIVESHSEHLLRRLQRRIAEEVLPNSEAALYFCEYKNRVSKLNPLTMNVLGEIENWPADFFGDQFGELAATQRARLNRKKRS